MKNFYTPRWERHRKHQKKRKIQKGLLGHKTLLEIDALNCVYNVSFHWTIIQKKKEKKTLKLPVPVPFQRQQTTAGKSRLACPAPRGIRSFGSHFF